MLIFVIQFLIFMLFAAHCREWDRFLIAFIGFMLNAVIILIKLQI